MGWEIRHAVSIEGGRLQAQGRGAAGSRDPGPANGLPRWKQGVRIFCHVYIVFISPPVKVLCVFNLKNRRLGGYKYYNNNMTSAKASEGNTESEDCPYPTLRCLQC